MLICFDYDETFTADPEMWKRVISTMKNHNHVVILATMRYDAASEALPPSVTNLFDAVFYTGRKAKLLELERRGFKPDIWIEDNPRWLFKDG